MINLTAKGDQRFLDDVHVFTNTLARLQTQIGDRAVPVRDEAFHELSQAIRTMSRKCRLMQQRCDDAGQVAAVQQYFQNCIAQWFDTSWFMSRAKEKPRGYPGDFELLTSIYDGQVRSRGLGSYLDLYFLYSDLGQAVVARMHAAREFLNREVHYHDGDLTILNVASGPCREFFTGLSMPQTKRHIELYCIDSDGDALTFVTEKLAANRTPDLPDVKLVEYNALRMRSAKVNVKRFGFADIIYSIGLLDYIPDKHLIATMRGLRETLKPGGVAYFSFKDANGYDPAEYKWFVDWHFFERDEKQCHDLMTAAGFDPSRMSVERDDTGIIMNFVAFAGSRRSYRTDSAISSIDSIESPHELPAPVSDDG